MNKIIVGTLCAGIIIGGVAYATQHYQTTQAQTADVIVDEVTALETELARINTELAAGRMSETEASIARASVQNRLQSINEAVTRSGQLTLNAAERAIIAAQLERVKVALTNYQSTLVELDATAKPVRKGGGSRNRNLNQTLEDIVEQIEDTVAEIDPEYTPEDTFDITPEDTGTSTEPVVIDAETITASSTATTTTDVLIETPADEGTGTAPDTVEETAGDDEIIHS